MRAVQRCVALGAWRLPSFETHGDKRLFHRQVALTELWSAIPEHRPHLALLGPDAQIAMPDREKRRRLVARAVSRKAGPDGANAKDGVFAGKKADGRG